MAIKPKQWLFDNGHITTFGRGRMSAANKALIEQAVRDGVDIEGYSVSTSTGPVKSEDKTDKPVEVKRVKATNEKTVADIGSPTRPEDYWQAHVLDNGKKSPVGMRTVCNLCRTSLTFCHCRNPEVNIDHERAGMVLFSPRA